MSFLYHVLLLIDSTLKSFNYGYIFYLSAPLEASSAPIFRRQTQAALEVHEKACRLAKQVESEDPPKVRKEQVDKVSLSADEPWVSNPNEFSAPPTSADAFLERPGGEGVTTCSGFLGQAVGKVHNRLEFWK
jgi:hypothetical protein